jgi:hypothetical protein
MRLVTSLIITFSLAVVSCTKQEPPRVSSDRERTQEEINRSKACERVNFVDNLLYRNNLSALFECTGWNKQFPDMYKSLNQVEPKYWNHIFAPISKEFFDTRERRDRVFKKIKNLDAKNGLDDLGKVITALSQTNFYDAINALFVCADNPDDKSCLTRKGRIATKQEILDFISLIDIDPNLFGYLSRVIKHLVQAIQGDSEEFRNEIKKFYHKRGFDKLRLRLTDYFADRIIEGVSEEDRAFVAKLLFTKIKNTDQYVLEKWLKSDTLDSEKFHKLIAFSAIEKVDMIKDIMVIRNGFEEGLKCEYGEGEGQIVMDERQHVGQFLDSLLNLGHVDFNNKILRQSSLILTAIPYCDVISKYSSEITYIDGENIVTKTHTLSFKDVLSQMAELMGDKDNFNLAQILANASVSKDSPLPYYLMELMKGVIYQSLNELNKVILKNSENYYRILLPILKRMDPEVFPAGGAISMITMGKKYEKSFKGVAKFWKFLNDSEKNFLFYFIDRHLDDDTNYVLLFDFYFKMLEELPEAIKSISSSWTKDFVSKEKTYQAIKNIVKNLSGKETLGDFNKFFSRDHMVKMIKVLTRGVVLDDTELGKFDNQYSDNYVERSRKNPFDFVFSRSSLNINNIVNCAAAINSEQSDFYVLVRTLPDACKKAEKGEMAIKLFGWINYITQGYDHYNPNRAQSSQDSFLDPEGIFSPASSRSSIVLLTRIDRNFAPEGEKYGGIDYLLDSLFNTFYKMANPSGEVSGYYYEFEKMAIVLNEFNESSPSTALYRQSMFKKLTKKENFNQVHEYLASAASMFSEYGHWYNSNGEVGSIYDANEKQPEKYKCKNYHNLNIGGDPCPSTETIKKRVATLFDYFRIRNDKKTPTAIELLLKSAIADEGLFIPYEGDSQRAKRLSLHESFKMMYELSDRTDETNKKMVQFLPDGVKPSKVEPKEHLQEMTTVERVEVTIREINFDGSYLAAIYHNSVSRADDYNEAVGGTVKLFKTCHKLHFCGKTFTKNEYRMAHNGIQSYNGLLESNTVYGYGDYMQSLLQILVGSSSKKSRKENMLANLPKIPTKRQMRKHNGKIVYEVSAMSSFSNLGRILHDRVGRTKEEFEAFLNNKEFKLFSNELLRGYESSEVEKEGMALMDNLLTIKNEKGELLHEIIVDYLDSLSYADLKFVERTVSKLLVVLSYVGSPEILYHDEKLTTEELYFKRRYAKNNFYSFFKTINKAIKLWPTIVKALPTGLNGKEFKLLEVLKSINNLLSFFQMKLSQKISPSENTYYKFINESFLVMNEALFYKTDQHDTGMDYSLNLMRDLGPNRRIQNAIKSIYAYFYQLHAKRSGNAFIEFGENIKTLVNDQLLNMGSLKDYLQHTTRKETCLASTNKCKKNVHFDEPAGLLGFSLLPHENKTGTRLSVGMKNILVDDRDALSEMINDIMPYVDVVPAPGN